MISNELVKFVREQLTANVPKEQIAAILKPGGWTDADVAEAIQAVNLVPTPMVPKPPVFQQGQVGVNTGAVGSPTQGSTGQLGGSAVNPANPIGVQTQFQTAFRLQTMPATPSSGKKWPVIIVLVLFVLFLAGGGVWYFLYRDKTPVVVEPQQEKTIVTEVEKPLSVEVPTLPSPFDQDLLVSWTKIPDEQNSATAISAAGAMITKADKDFLSKYFSKGYDVKNLPTLSAATAVGARNVKTLQAFSATSVTPLFQCSLVMTPERCNQQPLRDIGRLLLLRSYVLEKAGKASEALSITTNLVDLGRKATVGVDEIVPLLVGWTLQKDGYQRIALLKSKLSAPFSISTEEKAGRIATLREEQKNVFKLLYARQTEVLEYLVDKNKAPSFPQTAADAASAEEYRKSIALGKFNLEETKKYFYDSYKTEIGNVDIACGGTLNRAPYDFNAEVNTATTTSNQASIENYVGKILYWTTHTSWDSLNNKRCELEELINTL